MCRMVNSEKEGFRTFSIRIPNSIYNQIKKLAEKEDRSVNKQILMYLRRSISEEKLKDEVVYNKHEEKEKKIQRGDG